MLMSLLKKIKIQKDKSNKVSYADTGTSRRRRIFIRIGQGTLGLLVFISLGLAIAVYRLGPLNLKELDNVSTIVVDRHGNLLRPYATANGRWRLPVRLEEVDPNLVKVLLAYEDKRFYEHQGFDLLAFGRAAWQFVKNGRIISGGSTITMQVARLLEGEQERTLRVKFIQVVRAIQLEKHFSKEQILSFYFTLAPYGGNIEGVRAASLTYFGKEPKNLSPHEIALLVALPQAPTARRPDRFPEQARLGRDRVLERMHRYGVLPQSDVTLSKKYTIPVNRVDFPIYAPHLADLEISKTPTSKRHILTIDRELQGGLEKLVSEHVRTLGPKLSAAVLVADHQTGEILAYVGSAGYLDHERFGSIDMVQAVRSPGSALKPFIYGLAFESGIVHPETLIDDKPVRFKDYAPENFDKSFHGTLSIRQALQTSLNVPVVKLLAAVSPARLAARFKIAGVQTEMPRNLTIALGGVGIKLKDMAELYSTFPRGGDPIRFHHQKVMGKTEAPREALSILSPTASWYVSDILKGTPAPKNAKGGSIAFKTGTSYGHRDAWSVGYDGRHVVAVWVGRPDNTATPGLMGLSAAAPLLFDSFRRISPERTPLPEAPNSVMKISTAQLPAPLKHFDQRMNVGQQEAQADRLFIAFPPNKAQLELIADTGGTHLPVSLKAEGGTLPLTWLADGKPIATSPHKRQIFWTPEGKGFVNLTVIDAKGDVDRVSIRLQ